METQSQPMIPKPPPFGFALQKNDNDFMKSNRFSTKKLTPYQQRIIEIKGHLVTVLDSSLIAWGKDNGYSANQMYMVSRRSFVCSTGVTRDIFEKLDLLEKNHV